MNKKTFLTRYIGGVFGLLFIVGVAADPLRSDNPLLQIIQHMPEKTWVKANQNTFSSVWTPQKYRVVDGEGYFANISGIIRAWSSFAWDSNRGNLIIYGGGHANYGGNDVYTWKSSTLQWERSSLPTQIEPIPGLPSNYWNTVDNGATPLSTHTYDNNVFLPKLDRFLTFGGAVFNTGGAYNRLLDDNSVVMTGPYLFDPNRADGNKVGGADGTGSDPTTLGGNMWKNRDIFIKINAPKVGFGSGMAVQTEEDGKDVIYVLGMSGADNMLYRYQINDINDPTKDTWTTVGGINNLAIQGTGAYDPVNKIFIRTGYPSTPYPWGGVSPEYPFIFWDLNNPGPNNPTQFLYPTNETNGVLLFKDLPGTGMDFDSITNRFYLWAGGNYVYSLSEPDGINGWRLAIDNPGISAGPGAGGLANDPGESSGGILGKWHYASDFGVFVGLKNPDDGEIWIYKPEGWVSPLMMDTDNDGIAVNSDNCAIVENADQRDTDQDGYGNVCDADFNNDLMTNSLDLGLFKRCYLKLAADAQCPRPQDADFNGDKLVDSIDLALLKTMYLKKPGPSGLTP